MLTTQDLLDGKYVR